MTTTPSSIDKNLRVVANLHFIDHSVGSDLNFGYDSPAESSFYKMQALDAVEAHFPNVFKMAKSYCEKTGVRLTYPVLKVMRRLVEDTASAFGYDLAEEALKRFASPPFEGVVKVRINIGFPDVWGIGIANPEEAKHGRFEFAPGSLVGRKNVGGVIAEALPMEYELILEVAPLEDAADRLAAENHVKAVLHRKATLAETESRQTAVIAADAVLAGVSMSEKEALDLFANLGIGKRDYAKIAVAARLLLEKQLRS